MDPDLCTLLISRAADNVTTNTTVWGMPDWVVWIIIAVLLLVSGLFSAAENAYSNCNKYHFHAEAAKGKRTAKLVTRLVDNFDNTLISVLVGNNIVQTLMSYLSAMLFYNLCQLYGLGAGIEAVLSTVVMAVLVYVVSDTVPKIISKSFPNRMAVFLAYPVLAVGILLYPIIFIFRLVLKGVYRLFHIKSDNLLSPDDLFNSVDEAINVEEETEEGEKPEALFEEDEKEIIDNVFTIGQIKVRDIYTPRERVVTLSSKDLVASSLNRKLPRIPYSRIPVCSKENRNEVIGILVLKNYFEEYAKDEHLNILSVLVEPVVTNLDEPITKVFATLKKEKTHMAIVVQNNKFVGVITMEDILDELINDLNAPEPLIRNKEKQL